ncbi:MAG: amino acid adenylation domain-containing protein [Lachnospiraceae bacterium]|nr:amino acid adenylation domain-containing protein [Lachnospiraceae bacterium]
MESRKDNKPVLDYVYRPVTELFEEQVRRQPQKTAVTACGESLSYEELNRRANKVANALIALGVQAETIVGILLGRNHHVYTARQGILKSGGAFVSITPDYPEDRIRYILEDSGAAFLITDQAQKQKLEAWQTAPSCPVLAIEELLENEDTGNPCRTIAEHDLCYCIYTSGSTGKPKGVMIEHGNLSNFVIPVETNYETRGITERANIYLALAAITFDVSIMEEFIPLTNGQTIVMANEEEIQNPLLLAELIVQQQVDCMITTPSFLSGLLDISQMTEALKQIAVYDLGAEAFPGGLYKKIVDIRPDAYIMNGYGPTEATISCTMKVITDSENITIGIPNANVQVYIVDENNEAVPDGELGELLICGKGVGRGYINLPEQTKNVFIDFHGERAYKAGDLARWNADGEIEFHGRVDNQVKLRGLRIELGEIEEVLNQFPGVKTSVVVVVDDAYLCGYFTADRPVDPQELSAFTADYLAYYMIPDVLVQLEELPLTANMKIDKKALPKPSLAQKDLELPKNRTQQKIFDLVASVTGNQKFGIQTNLYRAGLTSLGAMKLNLLLSEEFGITAKTSDIHEHHTVVLLEQFIKQAPRQTVHETRERYPLTGSQKGIFVECDKNPGSTVYNIPFLFQLDASVDLERLKEAVGKVVSAHAYLLARFGISEEGEMYQQPCSEAFVADCIHMTQEEFDRQKPELVRPFAIQGERLLRIELYETETAKYLLIDMHHIVADGNSYDIFFAELDEAYRGNELQPEAYTGFDTALDEEQAAKQGRVRKAALYYDGLLAGVEAESLPIADKKEAVPQKGLRTRRMQIPKETILAYCGQLQVTPNTLFTGLFGVVAARYANASDALFATIYNGRNDSRLERTICMLVKTLPVYCRFDSKTTIPAYMMALQNQLMDSMANDIVPFADLAAKYGMTADLIFAYQAELEDDFVLGDTLAKGEDLSLDLPKEPLLVQVREREGTYVLEAEYRADLYEAATIDGILESYEAAMTSMMNGKYIADISLLSPAQEALLDRFNQTEVPYDRSQTVLDLFREAARAVPERTAVVYEQVRLTYQELDEITDRIGAYLVKKGLGTEDPVAILIPRCEYMAIAALGVLKAGCAYQPLDATYPKERLQFMLEDSGTRLLIADESMISLVPDYQGEILFTSEIGKLPAADCALPTAKPEDLFVLLYTSGSTGVPKGCMLEYGNITAFCRWYHRYYGVTQESHVAAYASFGFDASMMDLFCALTKGTCVYIIAEEIRLDFLELNRYFEENGITHSFMTTQVGRQFALEMQCRSLQHLSIGGERLVPLEPPKGYCFYNVYGPTECTVFSTALRVNHYYDNIPIGKPLDNLKLYVVDDRGRRLPVGACGELLISGRQVARGYLNRPEKTAESFTVNPFTEELDYQRLYHTGDVVRWLEDGTIQFVGRRDAQVKIRGFRIELTEVEEVIRRFPGIKDATVAAFDEAGGGKYIAAYVVSDQTVEIEALHRFILETKPPYMVPAVTMQIEEIPLNQNQKVNKRALPKPQKRIEELVAPQTEMQKRIFTCVSEALGHQEFGVTTDIYFAGLTSVSAIRLNVLLAKEFDVVMKTADLKKHATVQQLERFILESGEGSQTHAAQEVYPLTNTQLGVFIDCTANMGTTIYNIPYLLKLDGSVDLGRLKEAAEQAVNAHPYLKVQLFLDDGGEARQRRMDDLPANVQFVEGLDMDTLVRPYGLFGEPLYRIEIHQTAEGNYLFIDLHHLIADGTSLGILLDHINQAYQGETLSPECYSSYDAALDHAAVVSSEAYRTAEEFYRTQFADCGGDTSFYPDKGGEKPSAGLVRQVEEQLGTKQVHALCQQFGITENVFFIGAFGILLGKYQFGQEAVFTTIYHGRNDSRLAGTVGMLVKTLPVRCRFEDDLQSYFQTLQNQLMNAMDYDCYPFFEISRNYQIQPNAMLVYQGDSFAFDSIGGAPAEEIPLSLNAAKAPVSLAVSIQDGRFVYELEYREDLFEPETVQFLLENFSKTVNGLAEGQTASQIQLLFEEEREMVNDPAFAGKTFVDLFREAVERYPDRPAVRDSRGTITYRELDRMSDYVASRLAEQEFGPEQVAGILCGRTSDFVIGYVGVMKAGGAYVPLDPEYPQERLEYMLEDSQAANLLAVREYADLVKFYKGTIFWLDEMSEVGREYQKEAEFTAPKPENLAYMIYTSGSTGKPKGVMIEQRNLVNLLLHMDHFLKFTPEDVCAEFASFCFDASVHDLFAPLAAGALLYIFPEETRKDAIQVAETIRREKITFGTFPTQMGELVAEVLTDDCALRCMTLGGEKFKRYYNRPYMMVNGYGPTENTVSSTEFVVDRDYKNIPIGKSQLNVRSYIVDEKLNRLPVGAAGELCVAGRQIARGYHNLPEKTAASFVENPFRTCADDARLYHTGDLVRMRGDGNIEYIGRIDSQVKIRGYRVELSEIEGAILSYPGVKETAVTVLEQGGNQYIVAYYTGVEVLAERWQEFLKPLLPDYMLPAFYVELERMPLTPGGKIDKRSLPVPEIETDTSGYEPPVNGTQQQLCEIFEKALGRERVGIEDHFFEMGGTSLSASKVAVLCMAKQIPVVYADIFKYPTVRQLAAFVCEDSVKEAEEQDELSAYGYEGITRILLPNRAKNADLVKKEELGDILLTGATGFLGIHVLKAFLDSYEGKVYALVRRGRHTSPEKRLMNMLMYYFDDPFEELFGKRIICIEGDITDEKSLEQVSGCSFGTLINCAACVKHFSADDTLERINVDGVRNLIALCSRLGRRLIQISTVSVAGEGMADKPGMDRELYEHELYIGQKITNEYIRTKFLAERYVLESVANGLDAKIIRVGNLMSRNSDGEFQINFVTNGFLRGVRGYVAVGSFPVSGMNERAEFSPIDSTAEAILKLAGTDRRFTVYHAYNSHHIYMGDLIYAMRNHGFDIRIVSDEEFEQAVNAYAAAHEDSEAVSGLIAYASREEEQLYGVGYQNRFTTEVLYRLGYKWPITDDRYLEHAIAALDQLGFFG